METGKVLKEGFLAPRRVVTAPVSLPSSRPDAHDSSGMVETLYHHPNARIISFTSSARALSVSPNREGTGTADEDEAGSLSWSSQLERTIAIGPFRIYRAPGSVAFLNCGSALQPILPKSQCWCIDEMNSRFVLQIRRPNYWRIELPVSDAQYEQLAHQFRDVLDRILQFEKTRCPFKRSFTVQLPEPPKTPLKKKPWKPVPRTLPIPSPDASPLSPIEPLTPRTRLRTSVSQDFMPELRPDMGLPSPPEVERPSTSPAEPPPSATDLIPLWEAKITTHQDSAIEHGTSKVGESIAGSSISHKTGLLSPAAIVLQGIPNDTLEPQVFTPPPSEKKQPSARSHSEDSVASSIRGHHTSALSTASGRHGADCVESEPSTLETDGTSYVHEGAGSRRGRMKARLRRTAIFHSTRPTHSEPDLTIVTTAAPTLVFTEVAAAAAAPDPDFVPVPASASIPATEEASGPSPAPEALTISAGNNTLEEEGNISPTESQDSFHSVQSWHSQPSLSPSYPSSRHESPERPLSPILVPANDDELVVDELTPIARELNLHGNGSLLGSANDDDLSETVVTEPVAGTGAVDDDLSGYDLPGAWKDSSPGIGTDGEGVRRCNRAKSTHPRPRTASSAFPMATLAPPTYVPRPRQLYRTGFETVKSIPMAIISRTCGLLLGPPSYLISLMLSVAAKITAGEWSGRVMGYGDNGETIPVQWDYSEGDFSDWSDDEP
ncbi:inheritance of peroxisomes protein 1-domain-containing protein [Stachybotrys elegans]|uniref:Inheritance of peroxisomes protein 1 n=1 Tax=Stachybotrys elegans TaxID=80388 RepID=A0A8K0WUW9_9HYPO|nr:inheritance of peroxisomes protein 1-domain-containing protein [Stachybotrys elegans]